MTAAQPLDATFRVPIRKDGAFATYLELPGSDDLLGTRRAVKVAGTPPAGCTGPPRGKCMKCESRQFTANTVTLID